ncbi:SOS response-associated peptidase [Pelagibacterium sp. H642]|uniref:SOS response-associated peptidase n=1 Tax=Pelagibacterium sp. H642 TaxID=1881069 RepID=UPI002815BB44|nr:SOS response-associated peptidase [Pelagibacterium sp. H642]WMT91323.1 SOS response-associated peptidase [Pelagibacterium sp. H642]
MCGRYAVTLPDEAMRQIFMTDNLIHSVPRYNIAPTQPVIAIWNDESRRTAKLARWGLVPHWVKDPREFPLLVNARAETMAEKPAFRDAVRHKRCILPASGYYEWKTLPNGKKLPYYITHQSGEPIALAGLYSSWMGPDGEEIDTVATITVPAGPDVEHIHDRMPAIMRGEQIDQWLDVRNVRFRDVESFVVPQPQGTMASHPVSIRVNSAVNEGPDLIEPVSENLQPETNDKSMTVKGKKSAQLDLF